VNLNPKLGRKVHRKLNLWHAFALFGKCFQIFATPLGESAEKRNVIKIANVFQFEGFILTSPSRVTEEGKPSGNKFYVFSHN
jgi:hypothetical protein